MATESVTLRVLLITGTVGSGKTSVLLEIGETLGHDGRSYAIVDLDWKGDLDAQHAMLREAVA